MFFKYNIIIVIIFLFPLFLDAKFDYDIKIDKSFFRHCKEEELSFSKIFYGNCFLSDNNCKHKYVQVDINANCDGIKKNRGFI